MNNSEVCGVWSWTCAATSSVDLLPTVVASALLPCTIRKMWRHRNNQMGIAECSKFDQYFTLPHHSHRTPIGLLGVQAESTRTPLGLHSDSTRTSLLNASWAIDKSLCWYDNSPLGLHSDSTRTQDLAFKLVSENIKGLHFQELNPQPLVSGLDKQISRCSNHLSQQPDIFSLY